MIYIEAVLLTSILAIGCFSAISDFRNGIVPNRLILIGLTIGLICHGVLLLLGFAPFYPYWLYNMLIADVIAFAMYWGKLWAAGDAKLFMVLYFLTPPRLFDVGQLTNSIVPFVFIFLPALLWIMVDSVIRLIKKEPHKKQPIVIKKWLIGFLITMIEVTGFHCMITMIFPSLVGNNDLFIFALIMAYAYFCGTSEIMRKWYVIVLHGIMSIVVWITKGWTFGMPDFKGYLVVVAIIAIQRIASMYNYQQIKTSKTMKGMILAAETVIMFQTSRVHSLPTDPSEQLTAKLTEEQADAVRRWESSKKGQENIWIVRKVPFAFMIALGFVAWMIFRLVR